MFVLEREIDGGMRHEEGDDHVMLVLDGDVKRSLALNVLHKTSTNNRFRLLPHLKTRESEMTERDPQSIRRACDVIMHFFHHNACLTSWLL